MTRGTIYRFNDVRVDVAAMQVLRGAEPVALEPQTFRLLQFLIENRDRVVSKEAIFDAVWEGRAVSDNALTRAIAQLRKALGDDPRTPLYIDTIPTVGYRFIGELREESAPVVALSAKPMPASSSRRWLWIGVAAVFVVLLTVAATMLVPLLWPGPAKQSSADLSSAQPIRLTSYPGAVDWPSFSPDGNEIAFQWSGAGSGEGNFDIFVKRLGVDTPPLRITSDPASDRWPAWSPDGKTIAFVRDLSPAKAQLMLVPAHGGPERKLSEIALAVDRVGYTPMWSQNSKWILIPAYTDTGMALYRFSAETGQGSPIVAPVQALGYRFPTLSPDGKTLLYVQHPSFNGGTLWSVHVDADLSILDTPRKLDTGSALVFQAIFTPDGKHIILRNLNGGSARLNADGTMSPQEGVPTLNGWARDMGFATRGNRLAYVMQKGNANIWRVALDGGAKHPEPLVAEEFREVYPQFSPDGHKIAYHGHRGAGFMNIWIADADGGNQHAITFFNSGVTGTAHWSPDSKMLSFDSNAEGGVYQVFTIGADGKGTQQLTHGSYENFGSSWSRDARWIYFSSSASGRHEVWKIPAQGGVPMQVTQSGGWMGTESRDGKTLFYCKDSPAATLWGRRVDGGSEEQITDSIYRCNYAVGKEGIYYTTQPAPDGRSQIIFYNFATGRTTMFLQMGTPDYGIDITPDGRYLAYGQLDNPGSDLMMVEGFK